MQIVGDNYTIRSLAERKFAEFLSGEKLTKLHGGELSILLNIIGKEGDTYNEYKYDAINRSTITIQFRQMSLPEVPPNFNRVALHSTGARVMLGTLLNLAGNDSGVAHLLNELSDIIMKSFSKNAETSAIYYGATTRTDFHYFFYHDLSTHETIAVRIQV